jgi:ribose transport system permease protein
MTDQLRVAPAPPKWPWLPSRLNGEAIRGAAILLPFVALFVVLSVASGPFFSTTNLLNVVNQQSAILIMAAAGTLVLVAGGIDLSIGAVYALGAVVSAKVTLQLGAGAGAAAGIAAGLIIGLANGVVVSVFRINSLIATLAMSFVVAGVASRVTSGNIIVLLDHPSFGNLANTEILGVNSSTWIAVIFVVGAGVLLARTAAGRYMYAIGGNAEAARLAGVRVRAVSVATFMISGAAAGLAGCIAASRVLTAGQTSPGPDVAFTVLAGIVVGGTSIMGGEGAVWRSVVGVLFIALIGNGFDLLGLDPFYKQIVLGLLIMIAVGIDAWSRRRGRA